MLFNFIITKYVIVKDIPVFNIHSHLIKSELSKLIKYDVIRNSVELNWLAHINGVNVLCYANSKLFKL